MLTALCDQYDSLHLGSMEEMLSSRTSVRTAGAVAI